MASVTTLCADVAALLRGLDVATTPAGLAPLPVAAPDMMKAPTWMEDAPTTPVAQLEAPYSYGGGGEVEKTTTSPDSKKNKTPECDYDAAIDATLRAMERDPAERPSPDYPHERQAGEMTMADRAKLIEKMHRFTTYYELPPGTLHRAVSFVDRFLSARKIAGGDRWRQLRLLGATAVFAAAKYEEQGTLDEIGANEVAVYAGSTPREVVDAELQLVAALGYRLSGPTAHTFVDHLTRHEEEEESEAVGVSTLAHHLADMALLDYRCVASRPSAVAASAIVLARLVVMGEECPTTTYTAEVLSECVDAIYDMHTCWRGLPAPG